MKKTIENLPFSLLAAVAFIGILIVVLQCILYQSKDKQNVRLIENNKNSLTEILKKDLKNADNLAEYNLLLADILEKIPDSANKLNGFTFYLSKAKEFNRDFNDLSSIESFKNPYVNDALFIHFLKEIKSRNLKIVEVNENFIVEPNFKSVYEVSKDKLPKEYKEILLEISKWSYEDLLTKISDNKKEFNYGKLLERVLEIKKLEDKYENYAYVGILKSRKDFYLKVLTDESFEYLYDEEKEVRKEIREAYSTVIKNNLDLEVSQRLREFLEK